MISDPMTLPDHRVARCLHVTLVAAMAAAWQFLLYRPNGPLWALLLLAPSFRSGISSGLTRNINGIATLRYRNLKLLR